MSPSLALLRLRLQLLEQRDQGVLGQRLFEAGQFVAAGRGLQPVMVPRGAATVGMGKRGGHGQSVEQGPSQGNVIF
jgi:hypothetical protein